MLMEQPLLDVENSCIVYLLIMTNLIGVGNLSPNPQSYSEKRTVEVHASRVPALSHISEGPKTIALDSAACCGCVTLPLQ